MLECDNRGMLLAFQEKYGSDVDVKNRVKADGNEEEQFGSIAVLFGELLFHNAGAIKNDGLENEDIYIGFGGDTPEEMDVELDQRVKEAASNRLSEKRKPRSTKKYLN